MAPGVKRKKTTAEDSTATAKPATKVAGKRQKTTKEVSASIETPPPTPNPESTTTAKNASGTSDGGDQPSNGLVNGTSTPTGQQAAAATEVAPRDTASEHLGTAPDTECRPQLTNGVAAKDLIDGAVNGNTARSGATLQTSAGPESNSALPTTESSGIIPSARIKKERVIPKEKELRDKLYQWCLKKKPVAENFSLAELEKSGIAPDQDALTTACNTLAQHLLFSPMGGRDTKALIYKTRSMDLAKKLTKVHPDYLTVFTHIEAASGSGMWLRPLEFKTGHSQAHLKKALKELVTHGAVTQIKSAETSKVIYVSADVEPDAKHRGGGFIDEGKLDEGMINVLSGVAVKFIQERSWAEQPRSAPHESVKPATIQKPKSKPKEGEPPAVEIEEDSGPALDRPLYPRWGTKTMELIPQHPSHFENYPSSHELLPYLNESGIAKEIVLKYSDVEQLLLKLEFDGYLERMRDADGVLPRTTRETRWRATRRAWRMNDRSESNQHFGPIEPEESGWLPGNGLSQVPCSRCPVKRKCEPGGVVSPEECVYLGEWLAF